MAASSRRKGVKGEREAALFFRAAGYELRGLEGLGDWLALRPERPTLHVEVKRQEKLRLPLWLRQATSEAPNGTVPVVAFRQNRGEWYAAVRLADLVELAR